MTNSIIFQGKPEWVSAQTTPEKTEELLHFLSGFTGKKVRFVFLALINSEPDEAEMESSVAMGGIYRVTELFQLVDNMRNYIILALEQAIKDTRTRRGKT